MNTNMLPIPSVTLNPLSLPAGGRFRRELKANRWAVRFAEFMGTIHKETEEKNPKAFGRNED